MKEVLFKIGCIFAFLSFQFVSKGQDNYPWDLWQSPEIKDFKTIQRNVETWFENKDKGKGSGYKHWKRWEYFNMSRLTPEKQITNFSVRSNIELERFQKLYPVPATTRSPLNVWMPWGENKYGSNAIPPGTGVINCIAFHPTDPNTLFVGGPATGLWKTTNHGISWTNITDGSFTNTGISSIVINRNNPDIIHILTGDGDGTDTYSSGIWYTSDGGNSWNPTSISWNAADQKRGFKMVADPNDPFTIFAATNQGLFKTVDGVNFVIALTGSFYDVVYKPGSSTTLYTSTKDQVFWSANSGFSWSFLPLVIADSERIQIAVTAQNPNIVYALGGGYKAQGENKNIPGFPGFYKSRDSGLSWELVSNSPAICSYNTQPGGFNEQVPYDLDIAVHPADTSKIFCGAINLYNSVDGGVNWNANALWLNFTSPAYVHADIHGLEYNPLNNRLYCVNDGGVYFSTDDGATFTDISTGLNINQFYDFCGTSQHSDYMIGGLYHNGSRVFTGIDTVSSLRGGDGTGCMINQEGIDTIYFSTQNGNLGRSTDGGETFTAIKPNPGGDGPFVSNFAMDPTNSRKIFAGWKRDTIYYSSDGGSTWNFSRVTPFGALFYYDINSISVASNGSTVYACNSHGIFKSIDGGVTWNILQPYNFLTFTNVRVHPSNPEIAIFTAGGYDSGQKVFLINGNSITNISYNLPNVPMNCSLYQSMGGKIYVGSDIGVYKLNVGETTWSLFSNGMPKTIIRDLEFYPNASKLRAATFGRGIWEIEVECQNILNLTEANDPNFGLPQFQYNQASTQIFSNRKILADSSKIIYKSGSLIQLTPGFTATAGNNVYMSIKGCGENIDP